MKVLFLTFIPSPYRLSFFEELGKHCDLTVLFERGQSKYRKGNWKDFQFNGYKGIILKGITAYLQDRFCPGCFGYITDRSYDVVVLSNPLSPTGIFAASVMRLLCIPYIVECDGAFPTGVSNWKTRLKGYVMKHAKLCLSPGKKADEYFVETGVLPTNIFRYPFTSVSEEDIICEPLNEIKKSDLRKEIGMAEGFTVISVGQFIHRKGFDTLLKVAAKCRDANFVIIGDKPTQEYLDIVTDNNLKNVRFMEFMPKSEVYKWLKASDLYLMSTRYDIWGLVVNEALASGLPVVSTNMCLASLEMIKEEANGYLTAVDDIDKMAEYVNYIQSNPNKANSMSKGAIRVARRYTFATMADAHIHAFNTFKQKKNEVVKS